MVQLTEGAAQDVESFGDHVKGAFGSSWKEDLCEGNHIDGEIAVGSPTLLVISSSTLRSLDLLRYNLLFQSATVQEQVSSFALSVFLLDN